MGFFARLFGRTRPTTLDQAATNMVSLVVLVSQPVHLDVPTVQRLLDEVFPGRFVPKTDSSFVIEGTGPEQLFVKSVIPQNAGVFFVNVVPRPYTAVSGFLTKVTEPTLRSRVQGHTAWLSVDRVGAIGSVDDAYRFIGKALARLAPHDALAVVHPSSERTVPFEGSTLAQLRADNVLQALGFARA
jgi:hypothetical protein